MADTYNLIDEYFAAEEPPDVRAKAAEAARKAIALDSNLADAHVALAFGLWRHDWDFVQARKEFQPSINTPGGFEQARQLPADHGDGDTVDPT